MFSKLLWEDAEYQYISRRRRWWKLRRELDSAIERSEVQRAYMLLYLVGLDNAERTRFQALIGSARNFDKITDACVVQHLRPHLFEKSARVLRSSGKGKNSFSFRKCENKGR